MSKAVKIYVLILLALLVAIIYFDASKPKPIDWTPTYAIKDKNPLGLYVFDKEMSTIFKNQKTQKINVSPYEFFYEKYYKKDSINGEYRVKGTFISISENCDIDDESIRELCNWVRYGNSVFISSKLMPNILLDSLKLKMNSDYQFKDSIFNWVANKNLGIQKYKITENIGDNYFSKIDTLSTTVLGYQSGDSARVNYVKVPWINGNFYLHTQPAAFTNFHLLKSNHHEYAQKVLSYIPDGNLFLQIKNQTGKIISNSPLRYIFSQPALKWAWFIGVFGMIFFIIFNAKRKQRVIPIIESLTNTTVDFTKTIGNLYYQEGNHHDMINKKIFYLLEKIRNEYLLDTNNLNDDFEKKLHLKSGKNLIDIQKVVFLINSYRKSPHTSIEEDLIQIN